MNGVRAQVNALVAATMAVVLVAFLVPLGLILRREAEQRAISTATLTAQATAALVVASGPEASGLLSAGRDADGVLTSVFLPDGTVLGAPARRTPSVELAARGRAFAADAGDGIEVLAPVQGQDGVAIVRAHVTEATLHRGVARTWALLGVLGLLLFGLGLLLADRLGRRLVDSVTTLAATAGRLADGDLAARAGLTGPRELRRVGVGLNRLADRIGELLDAERREVADLAHRLRTPATALRLDAESLRDADERARLLSDVDVLGREMDEVIRTARRPVREGARPHADLASVAADRVAFWSVLAEDTGRALDCALPAGPVPVRVAAEDLAAALDALLENVFTHTPDGTPLRVTVTALPDGGGRIVVEDGGAGFAAGAGARGTGLGLDIARRTAAAAGGHARFTRSPLGGAHVALDFSAPA
ncbi:ATP-binding protein [Luedemannella helvata]|uniref:histidine kinase n=1 Tax=Luedemannella helvata TaxID=349315 RepID=A0ABN2K804_9ACTN